jgi:hypothetical protein
MELICFLFSKKNLFGPLQRTGMILVKMKMIINGQQK